MRGPGGGGDKRRHDPRAAEKTQQDLTKLTDDFSHDPSSVRVERACLKSVIRAKNAREAEAQHVRESAAGSYFFK